jgi:hypothetical protein
MSPWDAGAHRRDGEGEMGRMVVRMIVVFVRLVGDFWFGFDFWF